MWENARASYLVSSVARFAARVFRTVSHQTYQDRFAHWLLWHPPWIKQFWFDAP
jgi:hypothetical protein